MTKEELTKKFYRLWKPQHGMTQAGVILSAIEAMVEVMAEAIEEKTEQKSLEEKTGISKEEWDQWWNLSEKIFK
jgi:hypothetical protein